MKQPDEVMRRLGFTDSFDNKWGFVKRLHKQDTGRFKDSGIHLSVKIDKETWEIDTWVFDDNFGYSVDFENIKTPYFDKVRARYKEEMNRLRNAGVIEQIVKDDE